MAVEVIWACIVLLLLEVQVFQASYVKDDNNKIQSSDSLTIHLVNAVSKLMTEHAVDMKDMEHKLRKIEDTIEKKPTENNLVKKLNERVGNLEEQNTHYLEELKKVNAENSRLHKQQENLEKMLKMQEQNLLGKHADDITKIERKQQDDIIILEQKQRKDITEIYRSLSTKQSIKPVVGFHVALEHSQSSGGKVAFNRILSNYGNGWNSITHTFTVPTKGLYFVTLTIMNARGHGAVAQLMRGTTPLQTVWTENAHAHDSGTTSTVLLLNSGDLIYAKYGGGVIHGNEGLYSHLVGFLIQKTN